MIRGVDLSKYQTSTPSLAGLSFVILRASIGTTKDSMYDTHYAAARKAGLVVMAYHYGWADTASVEAQATFFLGVAKDADFLWVDQEGAFSDAQSNAFIAAVHATGRPIGLYHSSSGFEGVPADAQWVADWRTASVAAGHPLNAAGTGEFAGWDFWQFSGSPLDQDYMNPATTLASLLRTGYVTKAAAEAEVDAALAPLEERLATWGALLDENETKIADLEAQLAASASSLAAANAALAAAPAAERERIATAEAARIRAL